MKVLRQAGLLDYFHPTLLVYSKDVGLKKDSPEIFQYAAQVAGLQSTPEQCLFVGEDARERGHAVASGWHACPHPLLVQEVLTNRQLRYVRLDVPKPMRNTAWKAALKQYPLVPLHVEGPSGITVYAVTSEATVPVLINAQFTVTLLGESDLPERTELYLLRDDQAKESGFMDTRGEAAALFSKRDTARTVLESDNGRIVVALPPEVRLDSIHFENARHGHTLRLMPNLHLLDDPIPVPMRLVSASLTAESLLSDDEVVAWSALTDAVISERVERFCGQQPLKAGENRHIRSRHVAHPDNVAAVAALAAELRALASDRLSVRLHQFSHQNLTLHNVVAELPGQTKELVLVTAHLDSIARPGDPASDPAPGADDDMSGVAAVAAIAERMLALFTKETPPVRTIQFVLFNDEENGLVGSKAYARQLRVAQTRIAAVFQMDMIGFNRAEPKTWEIHVGYTPSHDTELRSLAVARMVEAAAARVSSSLPPPQIFGPGEADPAEQRSDHSSFQQYGYAACVVSEDFFVGPGQNSPEPEPNPNYHKVDDTFIDAIYAANIARAVGAAAWAVALDRVAPPVRSGFSKPKTKPIMKRELDTRKEGAEPFAKPLATRSRRSTVGPLAFIGTSGAPPPGQPTLIEKALAFVQNQPQAFGFAPDEPAEYTPDPTVQRTSSGAAAVHLHQYYRGIPVFTMTRTVRFSAESAIVDASGASAPVAAGLKTEPELSAAGAVRAAAEHLAQGGGVMKDEFGQEAPLPQIKAEGYNPDVITAFNLPNRPTVLSKGPFEKPVAAHLVIFPHPTGPRLAWHIAATFPDYADQYVVIVSADDHPREILYCVSTMHRVASASVRNLAPGSR